MGFFQNVFGWAKRYPIWFVIIMLLLTFITFGTILIVLGIGYLVFVFGKPAYLISKTMEKELDIETFKQAMNIYFTLPLHKTIKSLAKTLKYNKKKLKEFLIKIDDISRDNMNVIASNIITPPKSKTDEPKSLAFHLAYMLSVGGTILRNSDDKVINEFKGQIIPNLDGKNNIKLIFGLMLLAKAKNNNKSFKLLMENIDTFNSTVNSYIK